MGKKRCLNLYSAPILKINKNGEPEFRYLRPYLESAHIKKKKPLSDKQLYALDVLDALLESIRKSIQMSYEIGRFSFSFRLKFYTVEQASQTITNQNQY